MKLAPGLVVVALACWAPGARADAPAGTKAAALSWLRQSGAQQCPLVKDVAARVDAHLGRRAFVEPSAAQLFIEAAIKPADTTGWSVYIALSDDSGQALGTRELTVNRPDCAAAADAAGLVIALMLDPDAGANRPDAAFEAPEQPTPAQPQPPAPTPAEIAKPPATPPPPLAPQRAQPTAASDSESLRRRDPWRARLSAGGLVALGVLPGLAPGVLGSLRLSPASRRLGVEVSGLYLPAKSAEVRPGAGASFSAIGAGLTGWLVAWRNESLALSAAAGAQWGQISAVGYGFNNGTASAPSTLLNLMLDLELAWAVSEQWSLVGRPSFGVPLFRDKFEGTIDGATKRIFRPAPVIGQLTLGLAFGP